MVEPNVKVLPPSLEKAELVSLDGALGQADIHVLLVDHKDFKAIDPCRVNGKIFIDTRGCWPENH